jgi:hypothetical protein
MTIGRHAGTVEMSDTALLMSDSICEKRNAIITVQNDVIFNNSQYAGTANAVGVTLGFPVRLLV